MRLEKSRGTLMRVNRGSDARLRGRPRSPADCDGFAPDRDAGGVAGIRERLSTLRAGDAQLVLSKNECASTQAEVEIPCELPEASASSQEALALTPVWTTAGTSRPAGRRAVRGCRSTC